MEFQMVAWIVGTGITVLGLLLVIVQHYNKQLNEFMTSKYTSLEKQLEKREEEITKLRADMNADFVRMTQFTSHIDNFREDINKVFDQISQLSSATHELIGALKERHKNDTQH